MTGSHAASVRRPHQVSRGGMFKYPDERDSTLIRYYADYDPHAPPLRAPSLGTSPADAAAQWKQWILQLGAEGVAHFRQRAVQLQLVRALAVAIFPDQCEANRRVCASSALRRQLDTERIGLGRRCRGDLHTELAIVALKLRRRAALLREAVSSGQLPSDVAGAAGELIEATGELAALAFHDEANSQNVAFAVRSLFAHTMRPGYGRLEAAVRSSPAVLGGSDLRRRLDTVREAAARVLWTAEDLTDGFFRGGRNVGLRWLLGRRSGEREDDLFSPD